MTRDVRGGLIGLGYQAYAILRPDANGVFPKTWTDGNVKGGRTYLYSAVPRSRGYTAPVTFRRINSATLFDTVLVAADTVTGVLATTGASTAKVYVPISLAAGSVAGSSLVTTLAGTSTLPVNVQVAETAQPGNYRLYFANQFRVVKEVTVATGQTTYTVIARRNAAVANVGGTAVTNYAYDSASFTGTTPVDTIAVTQVGTPTVTTASGKQIETRTYNAASGLGFVFVSPAGAPYYISGSPTPANSFPVGYLTRSDFPGVGLSLNQARSDTLTLERIVKANGDTVPTQLRDNNAVQFREQTSARRSGRGLYQFIFKQDAFGPGVSEFTLTDVPTLQSQVNASLNARVVATIGTTSARIRDKIAAVTLSGTPATSPYTGQTLQATKFPFYVLTPRGDTAILAALPRNLLTGSTMRLGTGADTLRITPQADTWIPGDQFVVLEVITRDSTVTTGTGTSAVTTTFIDTVTKKPFQVKDTVVSFAPTVLGCNTPVETCNPIKYGTRGATGYLPYQDNWKLVIEYPRPFTLASEVQIAVAGGAPQQVRLTKAQLKQIRVVPNPYVVVSDVDRVTAGRTGDPRVIFTGVPQEGVLRIYSVSGQFLQQLSWTPADLNGTGDLAYNLRTREGLDLSSGLYIYVITAKGVNAGSPIARGKFVVIR